MLAKPGFDIPTKVSSSMAEITIISPNVVELVGLLPGRPEAARQKPSRAPPNSSNGAVDLRSSSGDAEKSTALRAANSNPSPRNDLADTPSRRDPPSPQRTRSNPTPSSGTTFLAQKLGQESSFRTRSLKRFETAVDAYKKAQATTSPVRRDDQVEFLTQRVDLLT